MLRDVFVLSLAVAGLLAASGCVNNGATLTEEQACLYHHENNPEEQARCRLPPDLRDGSPPEMLPQELPVRTNREPGD